MSGGGETSRRGLLGLAAGVVGAVAAGRAALAEDPPPAALPTVPDDATRVLGAGVTPRSERSPFESPAVSPTGHVSGTAYSPLQNFTGTITPTDVQFQRHHGGIAQIDPARYKLLLHGLVERPLTFTLAELRRFPHVTRAHFVECAGNGRKAYREPTPELTPQFIDGQLSNVEWTGVPLGQLLAEAGLKPQARWLLVEGGDASVLMRSLPIEKALDDCLIAFASNGEALRPAHGYPVRLVVPGWEANLSIKWLRRIEAVESPAMAKDETVRYTDALPGDLARQFSFVMDTKSIITSPSHPMRLTPGMWPISGLAWTGRGRITQVEVSTDGGVSWADAELFGAEASRAATRFVLPWRWDGAPTTLMSRAVDETGYVQPTYAAFQAARGMGADFHFNAIRAWRVAQDGLVTFVANPEAA